MKIETPAYSVSSSAYDQRLGQFLSADPFVKDPTNSQNDNRYAYCLNNPMKYTDPSGFTSYYVDGVQVSFETYRRMGGAKFKSESYGNSPFLFDFNIAKEQSTVRVSMGYQTVFNTLENIDIEGKGETTRFNITNVQWNRIEMLFTNYIPDREIESNNPNYPGVSISYEKGNEMGNYNPFTKTIHVGEKSYMKTDQSWLQHEYGHYLQHQYYGLAWFCWNVIPKSCFSALINNYEYHHSLDVELDATTSAKEYFECNGKSFTIGLLLQTQSQLVFLTKQYLSANIILGFVHFLHF